MAKWQPVTLILRDRPDKPATRLECECGALAIFVVATVEETHSSYADLDAFSPWCQECFEREQREQRETE